MIQFTGHMKKKEDQSVVASVLLRRGNKIITGSPEWEVLGRKRKGEGENGGAGLLVGRDGQDVQRVRKLNRGVYQ